LARDRIRWIVCEEMHALHDGVRCNDNIVARWLEERGIIGKIERAGVSRQRPEIARDQRVFTGWRLFEIGHDSKPVAPTLTSCGGDGSCGCGPAGRVHQALQITATGKL